MRDRLVSAEEQASYNHVFRHDADLPAESTILSEALTIASDVLDVGTGATGRTAKLVKSFGVRTVVSVEINTHAIAEFGESAERTGIELCAGDLAALPFEDNSFDVVLVAFHGMDYILDATVRAEAFAEVARVLRPGGRLILNGWNRLGILFSPYQLKSLTSLKIRARYVLRGDWFRRTLSDGNGLQLYQSTPRATAKEVEAASPLKLAYVIDSFAKSLNMARVTVTSMEPYLVFKLPEDQR